MPTDHDDFVKCCDCSCSAPEIAACQMATQAAYRRLSTINFADCAKRYGMEPDSMDKAFMKAQMASERSNHAARRSAHMAWFDTIPEAHQERPLYSARARQRRSDRTHWRAVCLFVVFVLSWAIASPWISGWLKGLVR